MLALVFIMGAAYILPVTSYSADYGFGSRVDRDLGQFSRDDSTQFGDDRALNSASGIHSREADAQALKWNPDTYGLQGNYWYNSNNGN